MTCPATERKVLATAAAIAIAGYLVLWLCVEPAVFRHSKSDFGTFYRAGRMVLAGDGQRVYDLQAESQYDDTLGTRPVDAEGNPVSLPFVFAPFALAIYTPLALLPYQYAEDVWYAVNTGMLLVLPLLFRRRLGIGAKTCAVAMIAPLLFLPAILALMQGQPSVLILLLFALGYTDLANGTDARAGCWFALASFKPQFVLPVVLALLLWRRRRAVYSFVLACCGLSLLSSFMVGWRATWSYPYALMHYAGMGGRLGAEHPASMPNLRGFLHVLLHDQTSPSTLQRITLAISLLLLAATGLLLRRCQLSPVSFSLLLLVTLLTSFHAYLHDDCLLLLPVFLMGMTAVQSRRKALTFSTAAAAAAIFAIPLLPTSLSTTALQTFLAIALFAGLLSIQMLDASSLRQVERGPDRRAAEMIRI
jgi:hypothetical protein